MRFHLLGLPYTQIRRDYSVDAFTIKILNLSRMLKKLSQTVMVYGTGGSDVECTEFIGILSEAEFKTFYPYDHKQHFFDYSNEPSWSLFNQRAAEAINTRKQSGDVILNPYGWRLQFVTENTHLPTIEPGIGHAGSVATNYRIFESYAWMFYSYGKQNISHPSHYDAVIPNYYDLADFSLIPTKQDYLCYVGRLSEDKGWRVACDVAQKLGLPIKLAGQGVMDHPYKQAEHVGVVSIEERAQLMGNAKAVLVPTQYIEPFGSVVIESLLCGTPVVCSDFGSFPELIPQGVVGYRCRLFSDYVQAIEHIHTLDPYVCRHYAETYYAMDRAMNSYAEYFSRIEDLLSGGGWYSERSFNPTWLPRS